MNKIIIDTNPLVYIYHGIPGYGREYAELLGDLSNKNILVIPKIVYGELAVLFQKPNDLSAFLSDTGIVIGEMEKETYITAARRWERYNKRRVLLCHKCGNKIGEMTCAHCNAKINIRQHILTDFLIGAYALHTKGRRIVTNDKGYYSTYFPELKILSAD